MKVTAGAATAPVSKSKHSATPSKLRGATYNCKIGRDPQKVARWVGAFAHHHKLDFIQLQEISTYDQALRKIPGYHLITFPGSKDHGETGILVRDGLASTKGASLQATEGWTNVRGGKAQPRAATTVRIAGWLKLVSLHAPPGIDWKNGHAVGPEQRVKAYGSLMKKVLGAADRLEKNHPERGLLIAGDWNEGAATGGKWSPSWLAAQADLKKHANGRIDWAMSRGLKFSDMKVGPSGGSDHRIVMYTVERPAKQKP